MAKLVSIEIDFDIHKLIEGERQGFDEPQYLALRRLLKLPNAPVDIPVDEPVVTEGRSWREGLVEIPHGSLARMKYDRGRQVFDGKFVNGKIVVNGKGYDSLSQAAAALAVTKKGTNTSLNGWKYWYAKLPGASEWTSLLVMRDKAMDGLKFTL